MRYHPGKVLPALEAVHIKSYRASGENKIQNGILGRSEIWKLFRTGYVTVTPEYRFDVSERIREEFENGGYYCTFHGQKIYVPAKPDLKPGRELLVWHNDNVFKGLRN